MRPSFPRLLLPAALALLLTACSSPPQPHWQPLDDLDDDALHAWLQHQGIVPQQSRVAEAAVAAPSLISTVMGLIGTPYARGGTSAATGFDCSGFVQSVYAEVTGLRLPRIARDQARATKTIGRAELQPGDLVFFNTLGQRFSHVGIYVGDGNFVHSPRPGASVRLESMRKRYWASRFNGARRVLLP